MKAGIQYSGFFLRGVYEREGTNLRPVTATECVERRQLFIGSES
jgi:hypothetical protein